MRVGEWVRERVCVGGCERERERERKVVDKLETNV